MLDLILVILFCIIGVLIGIITGLLPGLHVNNIALILLSFSPIFIDIFDFLSDYGINSQFIFILICVLIITNSISHSFHDFITSTFLGAPDEDTALSVLPAHGMLLEGKGYDAIVYSALGSYGSIIFCFLIVYPIRFIIGSPLYLYSILQDIMLYVLIAITLFMICTEKGKIKDFGKKGIVPSVSGILFAVVVFFISGIFGIIILNFTLDSPIGLSSSVLFPALAGLFGMPTLLSSVITKPNIPKQKLEQIKINKKEKRASILSVVTGTLAGILVSIIPGITSSTGTILAMNSRGESDKKQTIVTLSAVNTACAFFVVIVLFTLSRSRSGATLAVMELISIEQWDMLLMPSSLCYLLIALLFGGTLSYFTTLLIGKLFARHFEKAPYQLIVSLTIALIISLVFIFTGFMGIFILIVAIAIGFLPVQWGVRRSHCMGILLVPIILYYL